MFLGTALYIQGPGTRRTLTAVMTLVVTALFLLCYGAAETADSPDQKVVASITGASLKTIMANETYAVLTVDEDGHLIGRADGSPFVIIVAQNRSSLLFRYGGTRTNATARKINQWNKSKRFSRAYLDDENDPVLELDLDLDGGVTVARIKGFVRTAVASMKLFRVEVCQ